MIIPPNASGRSSAWLEHLLWEQGVARSNRVAPTTFSFHDLTMDTLFHLRKFLQAVLLNPALVLLAVVLVGTVRASLKKRPPSRWVVASALALVIP